MKERGSWGGKRDGAGRKRRSKLQSRVKRPRVSYKTPLHVTVRMRGGVPGLRSKTTLQAFRRALSLARQRGLICVHFSLLRNHMHMIVEAPSNASLTRALRSLNTSWAKQLNARLERKGPVLFDRYHLRALHTPYEIKTALRYVLCNELRHELEASTGHRPRLATLSQIELDLFSSARHLGSGRRLFPRASRIQRPPPWPEWKQWLDGILSPPRHAFLRWIVA